MLLEDRSRFGTYVNGEAVGKGGSVPLRNDDPTTDAAAELLRELEQRYASQALGDGLAERAERVSSVGASGARRSGRAVRLANRYILTRRMRCVSLLSWVSVTVRFAIVGSLLRVGEPSVLKIS